MKNTFKARTWLLIAEIKRDYILLTVTDTCSWPPVWACSGWVCRSNRGRARHAWWPLRRWCSTHSPDWLCKESKKRSSVQFNLTFLTTAMAKWILLLLAPHWITCLFVSDTIFIHPRKSHYHHVNLPFLSCDSLVSFHQKFGHLSSFTPLSLYSRLYCLLLWMVELRCWSHPLLLSLLFVIIPM